MKTPTLEAVAWILIAAAFLALVILF